ncbi:MAG: HEPN domain-containing protein [Beijerinckiaceae bacterium]
MSSSVVIVAGYMRKAERALDEAHLLLSRQATEGACSRAYYAMHGAAHAALLATGYETPDTIIKTHHSLIAEFGKTLVLGGQIDATHGRAFNKVQDMRLLADYSAEPPSLAEAQEAVEQAEAFVVAVRSLIARLTP